MFLLNRRLDDDLQRSNEWKESLYPRGNGECFQFLKTGVCANLWHSEEVIYQLMIVLYTSNCTEVNQSFISSRIRIECILLSWRKSGVCMIWSPYFSFPRYDLEFQVVHHYISHLMQLLCHVLVLQNWSHKLIKFLHFDCHRTTQNCCVFWY